jgi:hypothetical protein
MDWKPFDTAPEDGSEILAYGFYIYPGDVDRTEYWYIISYDPTDEIYPWYSTCEERFKIDFFHSWAPLTRPNYEFFDFFFSKISINEGGENETY